MTLNLPALNVDLLSKVVTWAYLDAENDTADTFGEAWGRWDQGAWFSSGDGETDNVCGSSYCIAGQTVAQVGYSMVIDWRGSATWCQQRVFDGLDADGKPKYKEVGEQRSISDVGQEALGLTSEEANYLFDGGNRIGAVIGYAMLFAAVRGVTLNLPVEAEDAAEAFWSVDNSERFVDRFYFADNDRTNVTQAYRTAAKTLDYTDPVCSECFRPLD